MRVTSNKRDAFNIMSHDQFRNDCMRTMHHMHVAQIATMYHMSIDDLIDDAYANEFDDYEIYDHNDFNRMIDTIYAHIN